MSTSKDEIYAARSYPPEVIPQLKSALSLLRQAEQVLDHVTSIDAVQAGSPAEYSLLTLIEAISYLQGDEDDVGPPRGPRLVVDNTRSEVRP